MYIRPRAEGGGSHATLTGTHRQYLSGVVDKQGNVENKTREAIRERLKESLFDFMTMFYHLEEKDIRLAFEEGTHRDDGPVRYSMPRWKWGFIGSPYDNKPGYPREGDYDSGFDGKSLNEATIEKVLRENSAINESALDDASMSELLDATESKASPSTQRALIHSVAFLCRIAEAGQLDIRDTIEQGLETYHREYSRQDKIPAIREDSVGTVEKRAYEKGDLLAGERRGLERRELWERITKYEEQNGD